MTEDRTATLLDRLVAWLNSPTFSHQDPEIQFALTLAKAVYAHLYIAWIHPFGDGNGRTARLLEFLILANCRVVPVPAAHLLSNHYNLTRDRYYQERHEGVAQVSVYGLGDCDLIRAGLGGVHNCPAVVFAGPA